MPMITRLFILMSVQFLTLTCFAEPYQTHAAIFAAAKSYIQANLPTGTDVDVSFTPLDPRLQLSACPQALEILNPAQNIKPGRNAIGVKCIGERPWSLYLAANIKIFENIVVLTQSVKRGDIITKEQLNLMKIDLSQVRSGYLPTIDLAAGQQATRNMAGGTTLSPRDVTKAILVKPGR